MPSVSAEFETGPLSDAIQKAARVAPVKGAAFDRAAGIVIEVGPNGATVMATNLDVTYQQKIKVNSFVGDVEVRRWRLPSTLLNQLVGALPLGAGHTITFVDKEDEQMRVTCGRMVAKFAIISTKNYPLVPEFENDGMVEANEFAARVGQVSWAPAKEANTPLAGVHIDGNRLIACDRMCLAMVPCVVAVDRPITAPLDTLAGLLKTATDTKAKANDKKLMLQLDAETQATTTLLEGMYPDVDKRVVRDNFTIQVKFDPNMLSEVLNRMLVLVRGEALPYVSITLKGDSLVAAMTLDIDNGENGRIQDQVDLDTDFKGEYVFVMTPQYLLNAVGGARGDVVTMLLGHPDPAKGRFSTVCIKDDKGYECHVAPRVKSDVKGTDAK